MTPEGEPSNGLFPGYIVDYTDPVDTCPVDAVLRDDDQAWS